MASNYPAFDVTIDNDDGTSTFLPLQVVHVYDVTNLAALADLTADASGVVPSGSVASAPGSLLRFYFLIPVTAGDPHSGICGFAEVFTT